MTNSPLESLKEIDGKWYYFHKNFKKGEKKGLAYLKFRIQRPLIKFHSKVYNFFNPKTPWLCPSAIEFLKIFLQKEMNGVEFGSGRSTYFFASRSKFVVSVEHHKGWHSKVTKQLLKEGITNVDYKLIEKEAAKDIKSTPAFYADFNINEESFSYRSDYYNYFNALSEYENDFFDYILIDGRARPESLFTSIPKLKSGGLLILDNSERKRYSIVFDKLQQWETHNCTSGLTDTTFWVKP